MGQSSKDRAGGSSRPTALAGVIVMLLVSWASTGRAYGPGTHLREAWTYIEQLEAEAGPQAAWVDRELLRDPVNRRHFLIGAIFPDVGRRVRDMGFDPHRLDVLEGLLAATADPTPDQEPLRAFVLGNALHALSDSAAQVFLVPYLTAATDVGVVDVLVDRFDGPGGENEFFVEAVADVYVGDLHAVVDLYYDLTPWASEPLDLHPVLEQYYAAAGGILGELPVEPATFAENTYALLDQVSGVLGALNPDAAHTIVDQIVTSSGPELFDFLTGAGAAFLGLGGIELGDDGIDRAAREALMAHPLVADANLYEVYETWFGRLGSAFLLDAFDTATVFESWRTWRGPPLLAASIQSLSWRLPDTMTTDPDVLVWELRFTDSAGADLATVESAAPVDLARLIATFYPSRDRDAVLRVEVRADGLGPAWADDPVVARGTVEMAGLPPTGAPPHRDTVELAFAPGDWLADTLGFYAVVWDETLSEDRPILVSQPDPYQELDGVDLTLPVWEAVFSPVDGWSPYLSVAQPLLDTDQAYVDLRVRDRRYRRQGVPAAVAELQRDGNSSQAITTNDVGRRLVGPVTPGSYTVAAEDIQGWVGPSASTPFEVEAGATTIAVIEMEPVPQVVTEAPFTVTRDEVRGRIDDLRFTQSQGFEAAVAREPVPPSAGWSPTGPSIRMELSPPASDGESVYLFARAVASDDEPPGPAGCSHSIGVDASPPAAPALTVPTHWESSHEVLEGVVNSRDDHSGIAGYVVAIREMDGVDRVEAAADEGTGPGGTGATFSFAFEPAYAQAGVVEIEAVAVNGAGLESETRRLVLVDPRAGAIDDPADTGADVPADGQAELDAASCDGAPCGETPAGCGCRAGDTRAPSPVVGLVVMGLLWLWSRRLRRPDPSVRGAAARPPTRRDSRRRR